jgi:hypothetical protein
LRIIAALVCFAWVLGNASPAEAACVGPSVAVDHSSVARGDVLEIRGFYFGTDCNDTGGQGPVLGKPQTVISVKIVQGETVIPLAVVDAASNYRFVVQVTVPPELVVGPALVTASSVRVREVTYPIAITESAVPGAAPAPPTFVLGRDSSLPRIEPPQESSNTRWIVAGVLVAALAVAIVGVIMFRRQQRRPYQWIQDPK